MRPRTERWLAAVVALAMLLSPACLTRAARADNAGFALAPKGAVFALDARGAADMFIDGRGGVVRPVLEAIAGAQVLKTFDVLAQRAGAEPDRAARDVFGGRVAFFVPEGGDATRWMLALEADDARCQRVLGMFGARMVGPGRFESPGEAMLMRRAGGWLLMSPAGEGAAESLDLAQSRIAHEDPARSLLGDPLIQDLLPLDGGVRIFMRHDGPSEGATLVSASRKGASIVAQVVGRYSSPLPILGTARSQLDAHLVRAFEDRAVMVLASPADGKVAPADAFWLTLVPELAAPPAMRTNLAGERVLAVGQCRVHAMPALAMAWRIEDAEQARGDQEHFMRAVCCGMTRAAEAPAGGAVPSKAGAAEPSAADGPAPTECKALGPFADRYLGDGFRLGQSVLCWSTVSTDCGGWQVYASDPEWLTAVSERLGKESCSEGPRPDAGGIGFCDGPRAAGLLRRWMPLATRAPEDRVARGIEALSTALERLGRVRFQYEMPTPLTLRAVVEIEPVGTLEAPKGVQRREVREALKDTRR